MLAVVAMVLAARAAAMMKGRENVIRGMPYNVDNNLISYFIYFVKSCVNIFR